MSQMIYRYPSKNKSSDGVNGLVTVNGKEFDYKIVDSIEDGVPTGWAKTAAEALPKKKVVKPTED